MDTVRYILALIQLIGLPPGLILWLPIHSFAGFWRRLGPAWTYVVLAVPATILMGALFLTRHQLLRIEFGTNYLMLMLAILCLTMAVYIRLRLRKRLTFSILVGLPELSSGQYPGTLLTDGIYARIRHPRYVEVFFASLAYAFFANYLAAYVLVLLSAPVFYIVVLLEERELRQRFGDEYVEYCRRTPRFIPRVSSRR